MVHSVQGFGPIRLIELNDAVLASKKEYDLDISFHDLVNLEMPNEFKSDEWWKKRNL
jgi:hypothetical protein